MIQCKPKHVGANYYVLSCLRCNVVSVLTFYVISAWIGTVYTIYLRAVRFKFVDTIHCLRLKAQSVSETVSISIFRWNRERGEPSGYLPPQHGTSSGCGWGNGLEILRVAANTLNNQSCTANKGWSSNLEVG
jgi:hypothetical protein